MRDNSPYIEPTADCMEGHYHGPSRLDDQDARCDNCQAPDPTKETRDGYILCGPCWKEFES
jgi:hypothetical protein